MYFYCLSRNNNILLIFIRYILYFDMRKCKTREIFYDSHDLYICLYTHAQNDLFDT